MGGLLVALPPARRRECASMASEAIVASTGAWRHAYAIAATHSDKHRWHGEELSVEQQIKNHIARESFGLGDVQIAPGAKRGDGGGAEGWVEKAEVVLA